MEREELNQHVPDKLTTVCLCKRISRATIKKAIADGAEIQGDRVVVPFFYRM